MIIDGVGFSGGLHCETTTLGALLRHAGAELSEPMLFGLGEGLGFVYWDARNLDFPFLGGRTRPMEITRTAAGRLGLHLRVEETTSPRKAWRNVTAALDAGHPVGLQLDCYHLDYFTTRVHFGGHFVAMRGYDDTHAHLIDTAQQGGAVTTTLASLERARGERGPMTARHLSYTVSGSVAPLGDAIRDAVRANAHTFLHPPIANLGHRGIAKAARQVPAWLTRSADPSRDLPLAATLMERGGTGGALFRAIYRDFLAECAGVVDDDNLRLGQRMYAEIAPLWTEVAALIATAGETGDPGHLTAASAILTDLADRERRAMATLAAVGEPRRRPGRDQAESQSASG
jgi:hypothetical protein